MNVTTESKQNLSGPEMSCSDHDLILINLFSKFLSDCFTTRDKCLESSPCMHRHKFSYFRNIGIFLSTFVILTLS